MKVHGLDWTAFRLPLRTPFATAHGTFTHRAGVIVRLSTDNGIIGLGEASPLPGSSENALRDVIALLRKIQAALIGQPVAALALPPGCAPDSGLYASAAVHCALDTAACDVMAKVAGRTVAEFLAQEAARSVAINATIGDATTAAASQAALRARTSGFRCVKLKVGIARSVEEERERVAAVRDAVGPHIALRLDANGAWGVEQAIRTIQTLERYDLEFVEQPVPPGNLAALKRVREAVRTRIAADEEITDYNVACRVLASGAAQILILKPMVVGGLRSARQIIELAQAAGAVVVVTTSIDSGIGTVAALHLAATLPDGSPACGLATTDLLVSDLLAQPLAVSHGHMELPAGSGLGITLDEEALRQYRRRTAVG